MAATPPLAHAAFRALAALFALALTLPAMVHLGGIATADEVIVAKRAQDGIWECRGTGPGQSRCLVPPDAAVSAGVLLVGAVALAGVALGHRATLRAGMLLACAAAAVAVAFAFARSPVMGAALAVFFLTGALLFHLAAPPRAGPA